MTFKISYSAYSPTNLPETSNKNISIEINKLRHGDTSFKSKTKGNNEQSQSKIVGSDVLVK